MNHKKGYSINEKTLAGYIEEHEIVTWEQLTNEFNASKSTLWRRLQSVELLTSLNNNRKYFTSKKIVEENADGNGIWRSGGTAFSLSGPLNQTIIHLVENSDAGWSMDEFEKYLGASPKENVVGLFRDGEIKRGRFGHKYVYFSVTKSEEQIKSRIKMEPNCGIKVYAGDVKKAMKKTGDRVRGIIHEAMDYVEMDDRDISRMDILMASFMKPLKRINSDRSHAAYLQNNPVQEMFYDLKKTARAINDFQR